MVSFQKFFGVSRFRYVIFRCNNYCNLHCEFCSTFCHIPFNKNSEYLDRHKPYEISLSDIKVFCEKFKGIGEGGEGMHRLTGGEFTAIPVKKIEEIIELFHSHNRRVWLMTNGFNVMGIRKSVLEKISKITLDDHGINTDLIMKVNKYLRINFKKFRKKRVNIKHTKSHYDLHSDRRIAIKGIKCHRWLRAPVLFKGVFYPCCTLPCLEMFDKNEFIREALISVGWELDCSNLISNIKNWRETLPDYVNNQCKYKCWEPQLRHKKRVRYPITLKERDRIEK